MAYENLDAFIEELDAEELIGKGKEKVLDALRIIYIGQEKEETIGIPHGDVDTIFENENSRLLDMDMIYTVDHTGIWDFGYRCTERGSLVGSEIVKKIIEDSESDIRKFLDRMPPKMVSYWFQYSFEKTDSGHYSSRVPMHSFKYIVTKVFDSVDILDIAERVRKGIISLDMAVKTFDGKITVLAPEFGEFMEQYLVDLGSGANAYGTYQTLIDFADRRGFSTRGELLERLDRQGYTEDELEDLINEMADLGITSKYLAQPISTDDDFEDEDEDEDIKELRDEIIGERAISFAEDRPFRVYDRDGYDAYLKEMLLEPFKEELLKAE